MKKKSFIALGIAAALMMSACGGSNSSSSYDGGAYEPYAAEEAAEAYDVLSDANKRSNYDKFGFAGADGSGFGGFGGGGGFSVEDIFRNFGDIFGGHFGGSGGGGFGFGDIFGFGGGGSGRRVERGSDIRIHLKLTLEEIMSGVDKKVKITKLVHCPDCAGKGALSDSDIKSCPECKGSGYVVKTARSIFGITQSQSVCGRCGAGRNRQNGFRILLP